MKKCKKQKNSLSWPAFWHLWQVAQRVDFDPLCQCWPRTTQDHNMLHRPMDSSFGYQIFMIQKSLCENLFLTPPFPYQDYKTLCGGCFLLIFWHLQTDFNICTTVYLISLTIKVMNILITYVSVINLKGFSKKNLSIGLCLKGFLNYKDIHVRKYRACRTVVFDYIKVHWYVNVCYIRICSCKVFTMDL